jgi:adenosylcobinamide amidohydrolase
VFRVEQTDHATVLHLAEDMTCLSPAVYGGGIRQVRHVINYTLGDEWITYANMPAACEAIAKRHNCDPRRTTVLLTAAWQSGCRWSADAQTMATAGIGNAASLYATHHIEAAEAADAVGTINTVHVLDQTLTENALIEAYGIVKMAIADVLRRTGCTSVDEADGGMVAAGTPTDRSAIVCSQRHAPLHFAGLKTRVGVQLATQTNEALSSALTDKYG